MLNNKFILKFENVALRYYPDNEILKDVTFDVKSKDFIVLTGNSGTGKTSLLNMINMEIKPTRGFLSIFDQEVNTLSVNDIAMIRRNIGMIFQDFRLIEYLNIFDNIALPLRIMQIHEDEVQDRVSSIIKWVELEHFMYHNPCSLSGGQKQRVAIARAVIAKPELILADEPTGNLDYHIAQKIIHLFNELNKQGVAIIIATHNPEIVTTDHKIQFNIKNKLVKTHFS